MEIYFDKIRWHVLPKPDEEEYELKKEIGACLKELDQKRSDDKILFAFPVMDIDEDIALIITEEIAKQHGYSADDIRIMCDNNSYGTYRFDINRVKDYSEFPYMVQKRDEIKDVNMLSMLLTNKTIARDLINKMTTFSGTDYLLFYETKDTFYAFPVCDARDLDSVQEYIAKEQSGGVFFRYSKQDKKIEIFPQYAIPDLAFEQIMALEQLQIKENEKDYERD